MAERNLCLELGCPGLCCRDMIFENPEGDFLRCFPDAVEVTAMELSGLTDYPKGVYYFPDGGNELPGMVLGFINGPCPFVTTDGSCSNYESRTYAAKNFDIGGSKCNKIRMKAGLRPITKQDIENLVNTESSV